MAVARRWLEARVVDARAETPTARTLVLDVPGWPGHLPGQHLTVRLTSPDGYSAQRSYSIATPDSGARVELTVQLVPEGEVSEFLVTGVQVGDAFEVRGPVGGWFVWRAEDPAPLLLVAGGSGIVPLMAVVREHRRLLAPQPLELVVSVRSPEDLYYAGELAGLPGVTVVHTRRAPEGSGRPPARLSAPELAAVVARLPEQPRAYVCGPTGFVEAVADALVALGLDPAEVRTERFGPS
ncbi:ferredoxin-NADP reductase [Motilibacter rhizosphaerae]|uniref:Ferredoxin-NADP reductase n=1 Tax=Motilibacter rhizosphaerae TaxID=598652 RepID=A0A4Q7NRE2_9ACTN|nr:ferredoxin reductase [Motilibacter rhizosphaerae]RZS89611.1 ferredoxin-NADP reductase [Motilibacter rhizosphaerae]